MIPRKTFTSREFNQNTSQAKQAAKIAPVIITDRGQPAHVLMTYEHYQEIRTGSDKNIGELLSMEGAEDFNLESEIPKRTDLARAAEFD